MKKLLTILMLVLGVAALAACGGGDDAESESGGAASVLNFDGIDIAFDPTEATVKSGETITVNFDNVGALEHSWVLLAPGVEALEATESDALAGATSGLVQPGDAVTFEFIAPPAGDYVIACTVEGHVEAGMVADLTVEN
jgi:uncharacterized cupredoxin-like copper-binding protein